MGHGRVSVNARMLLALAAGLLFPPPAAAVRPSSRGAAPQEALRGRQSAAAFLVGHTVDRTASVAATAEGREEPSTLADYCSGGPPKMKTGMRVEANWNDFGEYYPGEVADINDDGTYDVKYDDGWTENNLESGDVKKVKGQTQEAKKKKSPDPACEVAKDVENLKKRVSKTQEDISLWSAGKRAKMARERDGNRAAKKATAAAASPAPAAATGAAPSAAPAAMTSEELEKLKKELEEVDEEIAEVKKDVDENDKTLKEQEGQGGQAGGQQTKVLTMDDLIAQYKERIKERRRELERLKARRQKQQQMLARLGAETVKLEDIEKAVEGIQKDMDEIRAKRDKLAADGRLDIELSASIEKLLAQADKLADRLKSLLEAEALAENQAKQLEEAKRKVEQMKRELEAAEQADDQAKVEELKQKKAEADEEEERVAKKVEAEFKLSLKAAEDMSSWLESVGASTAILDTGVVPSGNKWWRYRYEHTYVEGVIMIFIAALMIFWEWFVKRVRHHVYSLSHQRSHSMQQTGTMYVHWMEYLLGELTACLLVYLTIWLLSLWGIFHWFTIYVKGGQSLRLPTKGEEYQKIAFDICVVLIFTIILYFCLIFSVVHNGTFKILTWARYEVGQQKSSSSESEEEEEEEEGEAGKEESAEAGKQEKAATSPSRGRARVPVVTVPQPPVRAAGRRSSIEIIRTMTVASSESDYSKLKDFFFAEMEKRLPDFDSSAFSFWKYLRLNVRNTIDGLYAFGPMTWLPIIATMFVLMLLHRFAHVGYIRIMAFFLVVAFINLSLMLWVIVTVNQKLDDSMVTCRSNSSEGKVTPRESSRVNSETLKVAFKMYGSYTIFFLCYGASRTICQPWMWELHFWPVFRVACATALIVFFFLFKIAPVIPVFAASIALPPYADENSVMQMKETMQKDTLEAKEFASN